MVISLETAVLENNNLIFPAWDYDMIYSYNIGSHQLNRIEGYNCEGTYEGPKYGSIRKYKNKLICIPLYSEAVVVFDIDDKKSNKIKLELNNKKRDLFFESLIYNDKIYLFPGESECIVEIDLNIYKAEYYSISRSIIDKLANTNGSLVRHGLSLREDNVFLACLNTNKLLKFNLNSKKFDFIEINEAENLTSVCDGRNTNEIFVLTSGGAIYSVDISKNSTNIILEGTESNKALGYTEFQYLPHSNVIVILPFEEKNIIMFNLLTKETKTIPCDGYVFWSDQCEKNVYSYVFSEKKMIKIDTINMEIVEKFEINDNDIEFSKRENIILRHSSFNKNIYKEKEEDSLRQYIDYLLSET